MISCSSDDGINPLAKQHVVGILTWDPTQRLSCWLPANICSWLVFWEQLVPAFSLSFFLLFGLVKLCRNLVIYRTLFLQRRTLIELDENYTWPPVILLMLTSVCMYHVIQILSNVYSVLSVHICPL